MPAIFDPTNSDHLECLIKLACDVVREAAHDRPLESAADREALAVSCCRAAVAGLQAGLNSFDAPAAPRS